MGKILFFAQVLQHTIGLFFYRSKISLGWDQYRLFSNEFSFFTNVKKVLVQPKNIWTWPKISFWSYRRTGQKPFFLTTEKTYIFDRKWIHFFLNSQYYVEAFFTNISLRTTLSTNCNYSFHSWTFQFSIIPQIAWFICFTNNDLQACFQDSRFSYFDQIKIKLDSYLSSEVTIDPSTL